MRKTLLTISLLFHTAFTLYGTNSVQDSWLFVSKEIKYIPDSVESLYVDYWQTPEETYNRRAGDCEDFCILLGYYLNEIGYRVSLVRIQLQEQHCILKVDNDYIDAQQYGKFYIEKELKILKVYSFKEVMKELKKPRKLSYTRITKKEWENEKL